MTAPRENTILVVDDEPLLADTLVTVFQRAGYTAIAVYSCETALSLIAADRPSLVISDVIMPGMDGIRFAKTMRISYPECPVLLFSGNAETQELLDAAQHEGQSFEVLAKPVPLAQMLAKVASLLERSAPDRNALKS